MSRTRYIFKGDVELAKRYIKESSRVMRILGRMMKGRGLDQLVMRVDLTPHVRVKCSKVFGRKVVEIETHGGGKKKPTKRGCPEFLCFTVGYIIQPSKDEDGVDLDMMSVDRRYDVLLCIRKTNYVVLRRCRTSDFATYDIGEQVLVAKHWSSYHCIVNDSEAVIDEYNITPARCNYNKWVEYAA